LFGIFAALGTAVGNGTSFDFTAAFFFYDAECTESFTFVVIRHDEGVEGFKDFHVFELLKLAFERVPGNLSVFLDTFGG
jgi:hypothetical protein